MDSKLVLCQTLLEEVESQLATMMSEPGLHADTKLLMTNALSHVRQAISALGPESRTKGQSAGGS
jgi:hypothetical protein